MLPRLQAEERLRGITDGAAGGGNLERHDHRSLVGSLERAADVRRRAPEKANGAVLAAMGIGVRGPSAASHEALSGASENRDG